MTTYEILCKTHQDGMASERFDDMAKMIDNNAYIEGDSILDSYQKWVTSKVKKDFETFREAIACQVLGLAGESGELCDAIKKKYFHGKELPREHAVKEFGDILFYLCAASDLMGISFSEIVKANVKKLNERYPDGFDPVRAHGIGETPKEEEIPFEQDTMNFTGTTTNIPIETNKIKLHSSDRPIVSAGPMTPSDIASDADIAEAAHLHDQSRDWPASKGEGPALESD